MRLTAVFVLTLWAAAPAWASSAVVAELRAAADGAGAPLEPEVSAPATTAVYDDVVGDNAAGLGPDIARTSIGVGEDGTVSIRVDVPNVQALRSEHFFALFVDADRRIATGNWAAAGADFALAFDGASATAHLLRWGARGWEEAAAPSLTGSWADGASVSIDRDELGGTHAFDFWLGISAGAHSAGGHEDFAPDRGTWSFELPGAGPRPGDAAPVAHALPSRGRSGRLTPLRYHVADDGGETRERIQIFRGGRLVRTLTTAFAASREGEVYWYAWHAPSRLHGRLRFCVRAFDRAGNASPRSCARLRVARAA